MARNHTYKHIDIVNNSMMMQAWKVLYRLQSSASGIKNTRSVMKVFENKLLDLCSHLFANSMLRLSYCM